MKVTAKKSIKAYNFHPLHCLINSALRQGIMDIPDKLQAYFDLRNFLSITLFFYSTSMYTQFVLRLELHHKGYRKIEYKESEISHRVGQSFVRT